MKQSITTIILLIYVNTTWAATQTATLSVPTMDCPICPITIKHSLLKVTGVSQADVNFQNKQVTVTFNDNKTTTDALMLATKNAGYPSTLVKPNK